MPHREKWRQRAVVAVVGFSLLGNVLSAFYLQDVITRFNEYVDMRCEVSRDARQAILLFEQRHGLDVVDQENNERLGFRVIDCP